MIDIIIDYLNSYLKSRVLIQRFKYDIQNRFLINNPIK